MADSEIRFLFSEKTPQDGVIRLVQWPEGYVLWYHGEIVWKSWVGFPTQYAKDVQPIIDALCGPDGRETRF